MWLSLIPLRLHSGAAGSCLMCMHLIYMYLIVMGVTGFTVSTRVTRSGQKDTLSLAQLGLRILMATLFHKLH
jgi:hypothetical protein